MLPIGSKRQVVTAVRYRRRFPVVGRRDTQMQSSSNQMYFNTPMQPINDAQLRCPGRIAKSGSGPTRGAAVRHTELTRTQRAEVPLSGPIFRVHRVA